MKKRVLICDDDPDILFICSYIFEKQGCEVHTRTHCNNIIDMVKEVGPDVILMDKGTREDLLQPFQQAHAHDRHD